MPQAISGRKSQHRLGVASPSSRQLLLVFALRRATCMKVTSPLSKPRGEHCIGRRVAAAAKADDSHRASLLVWGLAAMAAAMSIPDCCGAVGRYSRDILSACLCGHPAAAWVGHTCVPRVGELSQLVSWQPTCRPCKPWPHPLAQGAVRRGGCLDLCQPHTVLQERGFRGLPPQRGA